MGMIINNNIAALNAWRNLSTSNSNLSSSLEKLSSGYRINRGADDPAGLLISEKLRAQIGGLTQASSNASDAISMVQTAEGALTEMNTMLNSIRTLAVHAANTGSNDTASIQADQTAVDKAIESMQRIATTTKFAGKNLLDGSATGSTINDTLTTGANVTQTGTISASAASDYNFSTYGSVQINITTAATHGAVSGGQVFGSAGVANAAASFWIYTMSGNTGLGSFEVSVSAGDTINDVVAQVNTHFASTGIWASNSTGVVSTGHLIIVNTNNYGTSAGITTSGAVNSVFANVSQTTGFGGDVAGSLGSIAMSGLGTTLYGASGTGWSSMVISLSVAIASTAGLATSGLQVTLGGGNLEFALTADAAIGDLITYGINSMQTDQIGVVAGLNSGGLNDIMSTGTFNLSSNAADAVSIIDKAISDVSTERANLGSFQKFTLETTIDNLGVTNENLTASESRIRDVDMAAEMMNFTKNQILVQAGTAMLAQANQLPQSVLKLLQ